MRTGLVLSVALLLVASLLEIWHWHQPRELLPPSKEACRALLNVTTNMTKKEVMFACREEVGKWSPDDDVWGPGRPIIADDETADANYLKALQCMAILLREFEEDL
eukprot:TRINITY_DN83697_c0_g1_i1.p1 TRINITY_DN83697_c0_g1~~TRINITY_DN83697_c0_g1_i1.p1  ORF type:complete len:106 (-),score=6.76 TRINITY_DN83697_c0_g1_i1:339-656(-)